MKIVRTFWGDLHRMGDRYPNQIKNAVNDNLNEMVYVWGTDNFEYLTNLGYTCELISEENYNFDLASDHTFYDFKSLNHKLFVLNLALQEWDEILFLDWDCKFVGELDNDFYRLLKEGSSLQIPLYTYPKKSLQWMIEKTNNTDINPFFIKLNEVIKNYSYEWGSNYIIPNTGFIYCRKPIDLLKISLENKLECLPDEFSVFMYAQKNNLTLDEYILRHEPKIIRGKVHEEAWWIKSENEFNKYVESLINKKIYFEHR